MTVRGIDDCGRAMIHDGIEAGIVERWEAFVGQYRSRLPRDALVVCFMATILREGIYEIVTEMREAEQG